MKEYKYTMKPPTPPYDESTIEFEGGGYETFGDALWFDTPSEELCRDMYNAILDVQAGKISAAEISGTSILTTITKNNVYTQLMLAFEEDLDPSNYPLSKPIPIDQFLFILREWHNFREVHKS